LVDLRKNRGSYARTGRVGIKELFGLKNRPVYLPAAGAAVRRATTGTGATADRCSRPAATRGEAGELRKLAPGALMAFGTGSRLAGLTYRSPQLESSFTFRTDIFVNRHIFFSDIKFNHFQLSSQAIRGSIQFVAAVK